MGTHQKNRRGSSKKRGQAMVEFAIMLPIFLMALLCFIQLSLMIHARFMLQYAAFCAARASIVYNGDDSEMRRSAAWALSPYFERLQNANSTELENAWNQAQNELMMYGSIEIITPTDAENLLKNGSSLKNTLGSNDRNMRVRVSWNFPLMIPVANSLFSGFFNNVAAPNWSGTHPGEYLASTVDQGINPRVVMFGDYTLRITTMNKNSPYHV
jgi:hypothetical protein